MRVILIVFAGIALLWFLAGCQNRPETPTSVADSIALSYATIEGAANQVAEACWPVTINPESGSPCDPKGLITSAERDEMKADLQAAKDHVDVAKFVWMNGGDAESRLAQADAILTLLIRTLEARQ